MYILGLSAYYNDSAACILKDGILVAAAQEESFSGIKNDKSFPINAINYCLKEANISTYDLEFISFYNKPLLKFERFLETYLENIPKGFNAFFKSIPIWIKEKVWIKSCIEKEIPFKGKILFPNHHMSCAAATFYTSSFKDSAILTIDGLSEWTTTSFGVGNSNTLTLFSDIKYPHSICLLYSAFVYYLGFKANFDENKVMELASYGQPKYKKIIYDNLVDVKDDGSFRMNMKFFDFMVSDRFTNEKFNNLFNSCPRIPGSPITQFWIDIAASIQLVTEEITLKIAKHIKTITKMENLCYSGNLVLNDVINKKLYNSNLFKNIHVLKTSSDAGGAIGAAFIVWYDYLRKERIIDKNLNFRNKLTIGPSYDNEVIREYLDKNNYSYEKLSNRDLPNIIAKLISKQKVIGWFRGRMEFSAGVIENRSILGDATSVEIIEKINLRIKYRENFRLLGFSYKSDDILQFDNYRRKNCNIFPIDIVDKKSNPEFLRLLSILNDKYNCKYIINTSLNISGEPIACNFKDAILCFMKTQIDYLILENYLLDKNIVQQDDLILNWE